MSKIKIAINFDEKYFLPDSTNEVFTELFICSSDTCFPCLGWTDFSSVVLQWWANELIKMRCLANYHAKLYFMDGPYRLEIFKDNKMGLEISCINSRGQNEINELTVSCSYVEFLLALQQAINDFMQMLHFVYPNKQAEKNLQPHFSDLSQQLKTIIAAIRAENS